MKRVLIVGAGGVGGVVAHKCAQHPEVFGEILLASRTLGRCEKVQREVRELTGRELEIATLDADDVQATARFLEQKRPDLVMNLALPYQDLTLMDACLLAKVDYLDTANYEPRDVAKFEYKWQWAYRERFEQAGLMALLGSGFDPGVTNVFSAYAAAELFDTVETLDILDCNAGDHGHKFATNFNPEINLREITQNGRYWQEGQWVETKPLEICEEFDFPEVGKRKAYLLYHEELESLCQNIKGLKRLRFFMTFGDAYLKHLEVLQNVGLTSIEPIEFQGQQVVPLQFLKALLPDPASLAPKYTGKTCIGCLVEGMKDGKRRRAFIYNVCDHAACYREVRAQAISYTTGVPAMVGAAMMLTGQWRRPGVWNMEQLPPKPFLELLGRVGLPWHVIDC